MNITEAIMKATGKAAGELYDTAVSDGRLDILQWVIAEINAGATTQTLLRDAKAGIMTMGKDAGVLKG